MNRRRIATIALAALWAACATTPEPVRAPPPKAEPLPTPDIAALRPGPGRLPRLADPTRYELSLTIDPRQERFQGITRIFLRVPAPTAEVHFHAEQMAIAKVTARVGDRDVPGSLSKADDSGARPDGNEHVARFPVALQGEVVLTFEHQGPFDDHLSGLYRAHEGDDWYASTQFEVTDARKMFPCLDEPGWKVPFQITLRVPEGMGAFSNAPEIWRQSEAGWTTVKFQDTKPIPTYLVAVAVGPFEVVEGRPAGRTPIRGLAAKGRGEYLGAGLEAHAELIPILERYFGQPYAFDKLDAAAVLEFAAGAMENPGLIIYREEYLLVDPATSSERNKRAVATVVAHELSHQWFGNLVTLAWWDDLWLNEAFAEWMAGKATDLWRPELEASIEQLDRREGMLNGDALSTALPIRQRGGGPAMGANFGVATFKGAALLGMIEHWVGPERFQAGVQHYLKDRAFQNATAEDLFKALDEAAADQPVREVVSSFIDRAGAPAIAAELDCSAPSAAKVVLTQSRYAGLGSAAEKGFPDGKPWKVPVCVAFPGAEAGAVKQACALVEGAPVTLPLGASCPAWIHPNAGEYGYYRWSVKPALLEALAAGLQMPASDEASRQLLRRSRVAFLDQTWAMVSSGALEPAAYLKVVEALAKRADRRQLLEVVGALGRVATTWEDRARTPQFAALVRRILEPVGRELTWQRRDDEDLDTLYLRPAVLSALAYFGQADWALAGAEERARAYLAAPQSVPPEVATAAVPVAARTGRLKAAELIAFLEQAKTPTERQIAVTALGSLPPGGELEDAIALLQTDKIRLQDYRSLLGPAMARAESRREAFEALKAQWPVLSKRAAGFGGGPIQLVMLAGQFCDAAGRDEALRFFEGQKLRSDRPLQNAKESSSRCIAIREAGEASLAAYLASTEVKPAGGKRLRR